MIFKTLYDNNIVVNEFISGSITVTGVMGFIVVFFIIVGVLFAATQK